MKEEQKYSSNPQLTELLETMVREVRHFAESQMTRIEQLTRIGIALSSEQDINKLLEMIIDEAMRFSNADAGTLYIVDENAKQLQFKILKNLSLNSHMGGTSGVEVTLPPVPLEVDGKPNYANVSSYVALTAESINIADVYQAEGFDFTGPKKYDAQTGYRSQSMLVVPMQNHDNEIIGVLQLLNSRHPKTGEVIPFSDDYEEMISSLASQAAVALENAELIKSLKDLFEAFIRSIATAIDEKSPYTGGHIRRVTELTMALAQKINESHEKPFADVHLSEEELEELRIAAWMHDVGKITTPEYVIDKSRKLETLFDRMELVKTRFELIKLQKKHDYLEKISAASDKAVRKKTEAQMQRELTQLDKDLEFLITCNRGENFLSDQDLERLQEIAARTYTIEGQTYPYLTPDELENLSVRKGTLTAAERKTIEHHALMSIKILNQLPFPKKLANVPVYAGGHHEKLDGSGYPYGLSGDKLPLQARIMAIADVFEALTARDRPYKKPMTLSKAVQILSRMCQDGHIDPDIYNVFINSGLYLEYARKELNPEQVDISPAR